MPRRSRYYAYCDTCEEKVSTTYTKERKARIAGESFHGVDDHPNEEIGIEVRDRHKQYFDEDEEEVAEA